MSHFSTIPASFAIKPNVYFITHQYLIINNSQSQRALSVSVRTVLWIYFASRRNCGLLPSDVSVTSVSTSPAAKLYQTWTIIQNGTNCVMDCHATARGSIPGENGVFTELHVLRKGQ